MPLELVDPSKTYELTHPSGAVFVMRHWTVGMQEEVDRKCYIQDGQGSFQFLVSKERELKLELALTGWRGVLQDGQPAPCEAEMKKKLPVGVMLWLVKEVDDRSGLRITPEEKKN